MSYFSELDLEMKEDYTDRSYRGFEEQLLRRYKDLNERYSHLSHKGAPIDGDDYFSKNDYRYAPLKCFSTLSDVYRAIEVAKEDLEIKCNVIIDNDGNVVECTEEEDDPNQISLFEVVLLPTWFQTAVAA